MNVNDYVELIEFENAVARQVEEPKKLKTTKTTFNKLYNLYRNFMADRINKKLQKERRKAAEKTVNTKSDFSYEWQVRKKAEKIANLEARLINFTTGNIVPHSSITYRAIKLSEAMLDTVKRNEYQFLSFGNKYISIPENERLDVFIPEQRPVNNDYSRNRKVINDEKEKLQKKAEKIENDFSDKQLRSSINKAINKNDLDLQKASNNAVNKVDKTFAKAAQKPEKIEVDNVKDIETVDINELEKAVDKILDKKYTVKDNGIKVKIEKSMPITVPERVVKSTNVDENKLEKSGIEIVTDAWDQIIELATDYDGYEADDYKEKMEELVNKFVDGHEKLSEREKDLVEMYKKSKKDSQKQVDVEDKRKEEKKSKDEKKQSNGSRENDKKNELEQYIDGTKSFDSLSIEELQQLRNKANDNLKKANEEKLQKEQELKQKDADKEQAERKVRQAIIDDVKNVYNQNQEVNKENKELGNMIELKQKEIEGFQSILKNENDLQMQTMLSNESKKATNTSSKKETK